MGDQSGFERGINRGLSGTHQWLVFRA